MQYAIVIALGAAVSLFHWASILIEHREDKSLEPEPRARRVFIGFADYATSRRLFLMRFDDQHHGAVFADPGSRTLSLPDRALRIAESFESFLHIYLDEPQKLTAPAD